MKKLFALSAALAFFGAGIVGCSNTAEGAKEDASQAGAAVSNAANTAVDKTKEAGAAVAEGTKQAVDATANAAHNAGAAVAEGTKQAVDATANAAHNAGQAVAGAGTTANVKLAIVADKELNDPDNKIDVDTKSEANTVVLTGHVKTNEMKKRAEQIAKQELQKGGSTDKVKNQLTVAAH